MSKPFVSHWRDFNSPLIRNEIWVGFSYWWPRLLGVPFVASGIMSRKNAIDYFVDDRALQQAQVVLMERVARDPRILSRLIKQSDMWAVEMNTYTEKIASGDITDWSATQMIRAYNKFAHMQTRQYAIGITLVLLDTSCGPRSFDALVCEIIGKRKRSDADALYAALMVPDQESFAREQERALVRIYDACMRYRACAELLGEEDDSRIASELVLVAPGIAQMLARHTATWAWIYYVYYGPAWKERDFVGIIRDWAQRGVHAHALLAAWDREKKEQQEKKSHAFAALRLTPHEQKLVSLAATVIWAKPRRKDFQSKSYWHMETWFREVARRLGISLREVRSMPQEMLSVALRKGRFDTKKVNEYFVHHIVYSGKTRVQVLTGSSARTFARKIQQKKVKVDGHVFTGQSACPGKATGVARIVNTPDDVRKMQDGDVLVSVATTPSIISAMRKASAILTDEGGLTCHAAIVSRELNIPCVVGLQVITEAVKDGDRVQVDATRGVVRRT